MLLMFLPRILFRLSFVLFLDGFVLIIITIVTWRAVRTLPVLRRGLNVSVNLTTPWWVLHLTLELRTTVDR